MAAHPGQARTGYRRMACATLAAGLALAGCGSHHHYSGVAPKLWAQTVCDAWDSWQQDTASRLSAFKTKTATLNTASDQRDQLVGLFDALRQTSDQMVTTVKAAGHPAVKEGPAAEDAYVSTLAAFPATYADAKTKAGGLPVDDVTKYTQGVEAISAELNTSLQQITARFSQIDRTYRDSTLTAALSQPACKSLAIPAAPATTAPPATAAPTTAAPGP